MGRPEAGLPEEDPELKFWRGLYPDAYRDGDGEIRSKMRLLDATDQVLAERQFADEMAQAGELQSRSTKKPRKRRPGSPKTDDQWNIVFESTLEIPGSQLTLAPIPTGPKRGFHILQTLSGVRGEEHEWNCGCREKDGIYYRCGKDDGCETEW